MAEPIDEIVARNRAGQPEALPCVCTAHPEVLRACLGLARDRGQVLSVEATSNQVNQDGGYTSQRPADFVAMVRDLADREDLPTAGLVLGGDHLGPQAWRQQGAAAAMRKARALVADYAAAGFTKIHLDCAEPCAGDPRALPEDVVASRTAELAASCLEAAPDPGRLRLIIGTEVPPPGGARNAHDPVPTRPEAAKATLATHQAAFDRAGLAKAWPQVVGLVVQPGVEFGPAEVHVLPKGRDRAFREVLRDRPGLALEAHSTDYQPPDAFARLAAMGFAFLKVGPALTHAWRRALYALDHLGRMAGADIGDVIAVMERLMTEDPAAWQGHYHGTDGDQRIARHSALSDRIRYYWQRPKAVAATRHLLEGMAARDLPDMLLAECFDMDEIATARSLQRQRDLPLPLALAHARVRTALAPYFLSTRQKPIRKGDAA